MSQLFPDSHEIQMAKNAAWSAEMERKERENLAHFHAEFGDSGTRSFCQCGATLYDETVCGRCGRES